MSKIELKPYQKEASAAIVDAIKKFEKVPGSEQRICVLDMPTGMGKTVVLGDILNKHVANNYQVLVLAPGAGGLDVQIRNALQNAVPNATVDLIVPSLVGAHNTRSTNSVLVSNWEALVSRDSSTGEYKNKLTRTTELYNLFDFLSREGGAPVLVIIDEAHHGSSRDAQAIRRFLNDIANALGYHPITIEASATPMIREDESVKHYFVHSTPISEGRKEGLIRSTVVLNDGINAALEKMTDQERAKTTAMTFILEGAYKKQEELRAAYIAEGVRSIPLIGITVPNGQKGNEVIELTKEFFATKGITEDNHQLAVFLSENKTANIAGIASEDSPIRVLIYKQAIATGWDCPRAQIVVGFRSIKSRVFSIQNRGRYYRTTGGRYYNNPRLNKMYIYSDEYNFIKGTTEEGIKNEQWVESAIVDAHPERQAEFAALGIWSGLYKRTNREPVPGPLIRSRMQEHLPALLEGWMKISPKDRALGVSFGETETLIDVADKDGFVGELGDQAISDNFNHNDFINQIKDYVTKPLDGSPVRDFGNNHRIAEIIRSALTSMLRKEQKFLSQWERESERIDFLQFVIQQFGSIKRQGNENNENARLLNVFVDAVMSGEGAPTPIRTEYDGGDGGSREGREFKFSGSWSPTKIRDIPVNDEHKVTGLRASCRLYSFSADVSYTGKLSKPENEFEEFLVGLKQEGKVADIWFEHNGTGSGDFVLPVTNGTNKLSFYPDYFGVITHHDGRKVPFIFEVKSSDFEGLDAVQGNTRAKSEALHQLGAKFGLAGSVVYQKDGDWVTARRDDNDSRRVVDVIQDGYAVEKRPPYAEWTNGSKPAVVPWNAEIEWFERLGVAE